MHVLGPIQDGLISLGIQSIISEDLSSLLLKLLGLNRLFGPKACMFFKVCESVNNG